MTEKKVGAYDDRYGPSFLFVVVLVALIAIVAVAIPAYQKRAAMPELLCVTLAWCQLE
jgi:hypothetical protein